MTNYYYEIETDKHKDCPQFIIVVADTIEKAIQSFDGFVRANGYYDSGGSIRRVAGIVKIEVKHRIIINSLK